MYAPDFVRGEYDTSFVNKHEKALQRATGNNEEFENMALIAAYMDYLMNLEENGMGTSAVQDNRPISRWRDFGLKKGVLRI